MNYRSAFFKVLIGVLFTIGLVYLILPGPLSIRDIPQLPASAKSAEPGDTVQTPNIAAYFSNYRRDEVMDYYIKNFSYIEVFGFKIPPIRLNHPPEEAFLFVRDQQPSTYLEQLVYPFRDSLFINGFEPFDAQNKPYKRGATNIVVGGQFFDSKTTIRFYSSVPVIRVIVYIGVWISGFLLVKVTLAAMKNK